MSSDINGLHGGYDTARVATPGSDAERRWLAERDNAAVAFLLRTGNADLIEVLGLDGAGLTSRHCQAPGCGNAILQTNKGGAQTYCSKSCSARALVAERRANAAEAKARLRRNV